MTILLTPIVTDTTSPLHELTKRAGVPVVKIERLYQMGAHLPAQGMIVFMIAEEQLQPLVRYMNELLTEVPEAVMNVPDAVYSVRWHTLVATLRRSDWETVSGQLAKSGLLASSPDQVAIRSAAASPIAEEVFADADRHTKTVQRSHGANRFLDPDGDSDLDDIE